MAKMRKKKKKREEKTPRKLRGLEIQKICASVTFLHQGRGPRSTSYLPLSGDGKHSTGHSEKESVPGLAQCSPCNARNTTDLSPRQFYVPHDSVASIFYKDCKQFLNVTIYLSISNNTVLILI